MTGPTPPPAPRPALALLLALLALAGCAGNGPLGNGLGTVVADIAVTNPKGETCNVAVRNGKDQTNLTLRGLHVCGGSLDELHADRSDGAQAAIAANAAVANHAIDVGGGLASTALGLAGLAAGKPPIPRPPAPAPPVVLPPFPTPAPGDGGDSGGNTLAPRHRTGAAPGTVSPLQAFLERRTLPRLESQEP